MTFEEFSTMVGRVIDDVYEEDGDSYITEYTEQQIVLKVWEEIAPLITGNG